MDEKIIGLDKNKDIDRRLEETTKELQREREKLMAVIRMSGDLIFEYDIAKDQMHYAGPEEGSLYCEKITEGYTEQLLREVDNRTDAVEQQLAEALHSGKPDICIELCKTPEHRNTERPGMNRRLSWKGFVQRIGFICKECRVTSLLN
mgnify:CR=1 FL=1